MDRYAILLGKTPPPPKPKIKSEKKPKKEKIKNTGLSNQEREEIIGRMLSSAEGRNRLAQSMIQPLRRRLDYNSLCRRIFRVDPLPDGALPIYEGDSNHSYGVSEDGENVTSLDGSQGRVSIPMFNIETNPQVPLSSVIQRRFSTIDRAQDLTFNEIESIETRDGLSILEVVTDYERRIITCSEISPSVLTEAFNQIEQADLTVGNIFMNSREYTVLRQFGRDFLDPIYQRSVLMSGRMATIWGVMISVSRRVAPGHIYVCAEPDMVGRMPLRDPTVYSADDPANRLIGWHCVERVGMSCLNPASVIRIEIS